MAHFSLWSWPEYSLIIYFILFFIGGVKTPPLFSLLSLLILPFTLYLYFLLPFVFNTYIFVPENLFEFFKNLILSVIIAIAVRLITSLLLKYFYYKRKKDENRKLYFISGIFKSVEALLILIFILWGLEYGDVLLAPRFPSIYNVMEKHNYIKIVNTKNPFYISETLKKLKIIITAASSPYLEKFQGKKAVKKLLKSDSIKNFQDELADIPEKIKKRNLSFLKDDSLLYFMKDKYLFTMLISDEFYDAARNSLPLDVLQVIDG